ncbi:MAG: cytochrome c oxidase subunit 3 [Salibacteraceae bacterium]
MAQKAAGTIMMDETEKTEIRKKTRKSLIWVAIVSIVMFFGGLTSAYVVRQAQGDWLYFDIPLVFYISTGCILLSSITMLLAQRTIKTGDNRKAARYIGATLLLGIAFSVLQYVGFLTLFDRGITFTGPGSNVSGSFFIIIVFAHAAHVFGGLVALMVTLVKSLRGAYTADDHVGIETTAIYWHFLDILWIYLLLFLVFIR